MGGGEVIKKGWLIKSPPLEQGGIKKAWRKRFFKLRSSKILEYYKNDDGDLLKGVINLEDCKSVHSDLAHKKYKFIFDIETRERTYYLVAQSQEEMKGWVDQLCRVCGLQVQDTDDPPILPPTTTTTTLDAVDNNASDSGPSISSPLYATAPVRTGGVAFNERFKPSEGGGGGGAGIESMYSLAHSVETNNVRRQLSADDQQIVPAGTPLFEALASKGITTGMPRSSSVSSAHGGDAVASNHVSEVSSLAPHNEEKQVTDSYNLYSPSPQNNILVRPVPKPRAATLNPRTSEQQLYSHHQQQQLTSSLAITDSSVGGWATQGSRAEVLDSGYMKPRPINKYPPNYDHLPIKIPPNYDHLPLHPVSDQIPSPKQHRSALLRDSSTSLGEVNPTYINTQHFAQEIPPAVNRSNKPLPPSPPQVDRRLKPGDPSPPTSSSSSLCAPIFPTRSTSLSNTLTKNQSKSSESDNSSDESPPIYLKQTSPNESPPTYPTRTSSLASTLETSGMSMKESYSCESDLPKASIRTTQYTHISFDVVTRKPVLDDDDDDDDDITTTTTSPTVPQSDTKSRPIPAPRMGLSHVNYSDVDLVATRALAEKYKASKKKKRVSLSEAERQALKDKPYINVHRERNDIDEETDPDYYTHMRNLTYEEALEIYRMEDNIDNDDDNLPKEDTGVPTSHLET